jgi:cytoskeletal protein RodZ
METSIGSQLRTARETKGLTLQDVEKAIHIRVHYLQALEDDDFSRLPSKTQARGFLRLYADFLKIPAFSPANPEEPPPAPIESAPPRIEPASLPANTGGQAVLPKEKTSGEQTSPGVTETESRMILGSGEGLPPAPVANPEGSELAYLAIYREIGDLLQGRRKTLSLSLDDISLHTRIKQEYLELIEAGRMDDLPSPVQGRGMISNYSEFLSLDSDAILTRFADALQLKRLEMLPPESIQEKNGETETSKTPIFEKVTKSPQIQNISRFLTPDLTIGGGLALLLVILIIWGAVQVISPAQEVPEATAPSISEMLLSTPTIDQALILTPGFGANTAIPLESTNAESTIEPQVVATTEGTAAFNQGSQPIQVYVIVNQRAFLKVSEDGSVKFNGRTIAGNAYQFSGFNKIELLTGNGAALQVFYNQTDLGLLGEPGEVINLVFTREGFATATPARPATPVNTRQPTLTLQPSATPTVTPYVP